VAEINAIVFLIVRRPLESQFGTALPRIDLMAFLLSCPTCGRKLEVTTADADQRMPCECGAQVQVPTVRGLRQLQEIPQAAATSSWTMAHSVVFLGALIAVAGLAFGAFLQLRAADVLPNTAFADDIRTMTPVETWELWSNFLRHGIGWRPRSGPQQQAAFRDYEDLRRWALLLYCVGGAGVLLAAFGFALLARPSKSKPRTKQGQRTSPGGRKPNPQPEPKAANPQPPTQ
jgi:hypothetical protein